MIATKPHEPLSLKPPVRRFRGQEFPRRDDYDVELAVRARGKAAKLCRSRLHGQLYHSGRMATQGLDNDWALSGRFHKVRIRMRPRDVAALMRAFYEDCRAGRLRIRVAGVELDAG